jgi:2-amino-4-hydroxy-6-hydroxymethyldihydropteridine diphosphokinase
MTALIALGSNLENPHLQLKRALEALQNIGEVIAKSSLYETVPVGGPAQQKNYLNAVIELWPFDMYQHPIKLLEALLSIETTQGRTRRVRWEARTLDLDVLAIDDLVVDTEELVLPHPRMMERAFVLVPLCEIKPQWQHPQTQIYACKANIEVSGVIKTNLEW